MTGISQASIAAKVAYAAIHAEREDDLGRHARDVLVFASHIDELREAMRIIRTLHADPGATAASCAEGCPGRWPCSTYAEADQALNPAD